MAMELSTRSYWLGLDPYEPDAPLEGEMRADVVIVGAGFSGLWTAYHLLKDDPGMTVVVIEASAVGYGASGRNGGFAMTLIHRGLKELVATVGAEQAKALHLAAEEAIDMIGRVCEVEKIDADLQPNGLLTISNSPLQDEVLRGEVETAERLGISGFELLEEQAIRSSVHSETFRCAVREQSCTLLNPARLVRGLKRAVIGAGGRVFEQTPMESLENTSGGVRIVTPKGAIEAQRVLLAANAYSSRIPSLERYVMPFYSYILLSQPLSDEQWSRVGWQGREGMEDRRTFLHYMRPTVDGRMMWAGRDAPYRPNGPDPKYDRDERVFKRLEETFAWTFPQLDDVEFEYRWGGPIGVTGSFMPCAGWLEEKRVAYAFGFAGHGVAITNMVALAMRDLILERDTDRVRLAIIGKKPINLGPRLLRDPLVRASSAHSLRQDDSGGSTKQPLLLRLLQRFS
ncbi:MAG: FAD-dependent oxidoreductase [Deltaproteobacteria bacterium]|nr:FAD-dependent oxidoreductase [Deltaproteobacteria bacterium]